MENKFAFFFAIMLAILTFASCAKGKFDLAIFGNEEAIGAGVYIDGRYSGKMKSFGVESSHYGKWLMYGTHLIEVKKEGYHTYKESINVTETESERYLRVRLEKDSS